MKKFVIGLITLKLALLAVFFTAACQTAELSPFAANAIAEPTATPVKIVDDKITRPTSEPYTGDLTIFEDANRAGNLQIDRVMEILKIKEGKTVADIGAGSGWFSTKAANKVGAKGKVFAVEINQEFINYINERAKKEKLGNIQTVLGTEEDPKLPENSVNAALILKTYHEIAEPVKVLQNLRKSLKKKGLVGIIDRNGNGEDHGLDKEIVIDELKRAGFVLKEEFDFTKADGMDYFLVFKMTK